MRKRLRTGRASAAGRFVCGSRAGEGERNEALDTTVYAMAALQGLISMGLHLNKEADN
jgi:phage terminase large subunit GpA-like protein